MTQMIAQTPVPPPPPADPYEPVELARAEGVRVVRAGLRRTRYRQGV